ncbi:MAG TPA: hypothetical protein VHV74_14685 [Pseudonocardiaceae bacterium]|nr:hypothetical protein [Pseudonocardiaceae bacterium]
MIELRVHGVRHTSPERLLDAVAAVDVAGDGAGRVVRPADRLRRPAPGPVLTADGRPLPRTLEGYVWGGLTSGARAVWAVLLPFSLVNAAFWMLPPVSPTRAGRVLGPACRWLVRLAGLLLTALLVEQAGLVTPYAMAAPLLAGLWLSRVPWRVGEHATPDSERALSRLPGAHTLPDPAAPRWRLAHLGLALAATVPALLGFPGAAVTWTAAGLAGCCVLFGIALVPSALLARREWTGLPAPLRPWAGGWFAAPVLAVAALLGAGFGAVPGIAVHQVFGVPSVPFWYVPLAAAWAVALAFALVAGLVVVAVRPPVPDLVGLLHADRSVDSAAAGRAWRERRIGHHAVPALAVVVVAALVTGIFVPDLVVGVTIGSWVGAGALVLAWLGGIPLVDVVGCWPRAAHPVVPACHALKTVPEVAARAAEYLTEPNTRVVLTGHGNGSVIAVAAATRLLAMGADVDRLGLVVAGSPLQWAWSRAFPSVVPHGGLRALFGDLDGRWRTMARGTDPVGGGVTTWARQVCGGALIGVGFLPDGTSGALPTAVAGPTGALVLGGDHWLPDPMRGPFAGRRWAPGVSRHADYYADPEWDRAVACAAGVESPTEVRTQQSLFVLPGRKSAAG